MEEFYNIEDTMSTEEFLKYGDNLKDFLIQEKYAFFFNKKMFKCGADVWKKI